jgi:hypothetical protein
VGFRTSTPVLDIHINTSNTPAVRLEQNNSGGFTAQTWDVAGNEAGFFVRDVTSGSRLPFRIIPGAPSESLRIHSNGNIGIGTASPAAKLHVASGEVRLPGGSASAGGLTSHFSFDTGGGNRQNFFRGTTVLADDGGFVGIGCLSPAADLVLGTGAQIACGTGTFSSIDAGAMMFTASSSRALKKNLSPVQIPDILDKIESVEVYNYDFIDGPVDRIGLMAEDFHQVFGRGSDKQLSGDEVQMALWLGLRELNARNQQLSATNEELVERLEALERALQAGSEGKSDR